MAWLFTIMKSLVVNLEDILAWLRNLRASSFCFWIVLLVLSAFFSMHLWMSILPFTPSFFFTKLFCDSTGEVVSESIQFVVYIRMLLPKYFFSSINDSANIIMADTQLCPKSSIVFYLSRTFWARCKMYNILKLSHAHCIVSLSTEGPMLLCIFRMNK